MDTSVPALEFDSVAVTYEGNAHPSIRIDSLRISAGERVALLGNNGSGKTTLLYAAAGLIPFAGTIRVGGKVLTPSSKRDIRARLGFLFSNPEDQILLPRVLDDVAFALSLRGVPPARQTTEAAAMLKQLEAEALAERSPHQLSQGERLRVALAGALIGKPTLLLLDEPSENLDPPGKRRLAAVLAEAGAAILLATHDLRFARRCCNRFVVLSDGGVQSDSATPEDLSTAWDY